MRNTNDKTHQLAAFLVLLLVLAIFAGLAIKSEGTPYHVLIGISLSVLAWALTFKIARMIDFLIKKPDIDQLPLHECYVMISESYVIGNTAFIILEDRAGEKFSAQCLATKIPPIGKCFKVVKPSGEESLPWQIVNFADMASS